MKNILVITFLTFSIHQGYAQLNQGGRRGGFPGGFPGGGGFDQGGHNHEEEPSPHGGKVQKVGKYKVEMVAELFLAKDKLTFYLFKKNMKPIYDFSIKGSVKIHYTDGTESESDLVLKQGNRFVSQADKTIGFHCIVEMIINEKTIKFEFNQEGL